jgi:hypothetical protein
MPPDVRHSPQPIAGAQWRANKKENEPMSIVRTGQEILVNTATANSQFGQEITALSNGGFVVTWDDQSQGVGGAGGDTSNDAVKAQVFAADGTPIGAEIRVNSATADRQFLPQITALSNGGFVVTWEDASQGVGGAGGDTSGLAVKAQVYAAGGAPVGAEILVNSATFGIQNGPQIAALSNGGFVVTWDDSSQGVGGAGADTDGLAVKAQVFAAGGTPVGTEIRVNSATAGDQYNPLITALSNGGFVVTWTDTSQGVGGTGGDTSSTAMKAQVFAAGGAPVGPEILVNSATVGDQDRQQITALSNGGFVVTWEDFSKGVGGTGGDTSGEAVKAQVFAAGGAPVGSEILVNSATASDQFAPQITALSSGGFVVAWHDDGNGVGGAGGDSSKEAVKAQVFKADGTRIGPEILVNTATEGAQDSPQIIALSNGGFVVTWEDFSQGVGGAGGDTDGAAVKAQEFASDGTPVGAEILVNSATAGDQEAPQITALANGGFAVAWDDHSLGVGGAGGDASGSAVKAQVFGFNLPQALANDFNGDGHSDILWQNTDGTPAIWSVNGTSLVSGQNVGFNPGAAWHEIGSGDFNHDGKSDILWQHEDGTIAEWFMNGANLISGASVTFNPGPSWHAIGTGDFNGDGKADILWQNQDGTPAVWLMNGLNIVSGANVGFNPGPAWHVIGAGDFNGDGKSDILWQNKDGTVAEWLMNGTSLISGASVAFNPGAAWHAIGTGDFNGDGKADILWQNADGTPAVWLMDGLNILQGQNVGFNPGPSWHALKAGDYNGDGKSDILWQNDDGTTAVWLMNGTSLVSGANVGVDPGSNWHVIPQHHDLFT